ncbi:MAG: Ni/Fe-hydrogenase 1 B-type cytochrome subunit [Eubacteriales bacterium]|nr:Ni/Fe-hydrogenase 1 B-type cytochrome subunit [Eubacteriales bacterium]MDN5364345.1 Ni/Fe-hydrogenase 1 B-type cytochrome subunit [Eubacteriales bacterium]
MKGERIVPIRRIAHWINLICMVVFVITGWYIHYPFKPGYMWLARYLHFAAACVFIINLLVRICWAFTPNGDWRKYFKVDLSKDTLRAIFRHYVLYDPLPEGDKYRLLQHTSYLVVVILFFVQIITGILLYESEGPVMERIITAIGGLQVVRQVHFFLTWVFIAFTIIHVYMAFAEEIDTTKEMFFGRGHEKGAYEK